MKSASLSISTVATFPPGFFLENITVLPDDTIFVTVANRKCIYAIPPAIAPGQPRHPMLMHQFPDDAWAMGIYTSRSKPNISYVLTTDFTSSGSRTHHLHVLDILNVAAGGHCTKLMRFPSAAKGLNGLVALREDVLLAADSFAGCIWRIDLKFDEHGTPTNANASEWMKDSIFDGHLVLPDFQPGVNGLKYSPTTNAVLFSSTQQRLMGKISVDPKTLMPNGSPLILLRNSQGDDMIIDENFETGPVAYLTTHRDNSIIRVPINGEAGDEVVAEATPDDKRVYGPTAGVWKWGQEGRTAYFTCDGGLKNPFPGETPQYGRILQVDFGHGPEDGA